jgi:hypothetical protein
MHSSPASHPSEEFEVRSASHEWRQIAESSRATAEGVFDTYVGNILSPHCALLHRERVDFSPRRPPLV